MDPQQLGVLCCTSSTFTVCSTLWALCVHSFSKPAQRPSLSKASMAVPPRPCCCHRTCLASLQLSGFAVPSLLILSSPYLCADALLADMFRGVVSLSSYLTSFVVGTALVVATVCLLLRKYILGNGEPPAAAGVCKGADPEECQPLRQGEAKELLAQGGSGCGAFIVSPIALPTAV